MNFSDSDLDRYARHIVLPDVGGVGQRRLKAARIAVVGAGGIGAGVLPALVGAGVGRITLFDDDAVELSNLQRQWLFTEEDIGALKAPLVRRFAEARDPNVQLDAHGSRLDAGNADNMLAGHELVIDGTDNFATRLAVNDSAVRLGIPLISAAAQQLQGQLGLWRGRPCYRCFVGDAFDSDDCDTCAETGVLGALTGLVGNMAAMMAIRLVCGIGGDTEAEAGTLHLYDGRANGWRRIAIPADPGCRACAP
ncbi:HesA/MoeB/ThiF family protein [Sphingomicrobium astaxanthinifaciens]|uniref:HesA/MoeB/ThiF family protein n=1 Tax=Sphingomicrobium astaxanthinifaciens TaxID=1227949 RepID=UPI001FCA98EE|nr:HesA/MoeB/ThiF family protein [Sphingomicrobium astaxanthinifaciens]MCJ7422105.1 HesA/MoeB/ThiF family protein [Sphingomicrobium astaxanthinifaciens]